MAKTCVAQMSQRGGRWRLYVALYGETWWPEHDFPQGAAIPTPPERSRALAVLGYAPAAGAEWEWIEDSEDPGDQASAVYLIAATTVEPVQPSWPQKPF